MPGTRHFYFALTDSPGHLLSGDLPDTIAVTLWYHLGSFAEPAGESTSAWRRYLSSSAPEQWPELFYDIHLDPAGLDIETGACMLAALHPQPPQAGERLVPAERRPVQDHEPVPRLVPRSSRALDFAEAIVSELGEEGCQYFLRENVPSAAGRPALCVMEWLLSQEWSERIVGPLSTFLGLAGARRLAATFGVDARGASPIPLLQLICGEAGIPSFPQVAGPLSASRRLSQEVARLLAGPSRKIEVLRRFMQEAGVLTESAVKQVLYAQVRLFPWFDKYLRTDLAKSGKLAEGPPELLLDPLPLGFLSRYLAGFLAHGGEGGRHHAEVAAILPRLGNCGEITGFLESIQAGRNLAAHDQLITDESDQLSRLAAALTAFVDLANHPAWEVIVPQVVYVKDCYSNAWGRHAVIIDEFGRVRTIFLVDIDNNQIGKLTYLYARNNPMPVAPVLISYRTGRSSEAAVIAR